MNAELGVEYEAATDQAYIRLAPASAMVDLKDQRPILDRSGGVTVHIILDIDSEGRIVGIEVPGASQALHPDLLEHGEQL